MPYPVHLSRNRRLKGSSTKFDWATATFVALPGRRHDRRFVALGGNC